MQDLQPAGLARRLGALLYDGLIIIALEIFAGGIVIAIFKMLLSLNVIQLGLYLDISDLLIHHPVIGPIYTAYLIAVWAGFFCFFWMKGGQTIGMKAWKLTLCNSNKQPISFMQAMIRLSTAAFGLGNLLVLIDPKKRSFQDIWARTQVYFIK